MEGGVAVARPSEWSHGWPGCQKFQFSAGLPWPKDRCALVLHPQYGTPQPLPPSSVPRWRGRDGIELLSLMLPPIGRRGDPLEMLQEQQSWRSGAVWTGPLVPGVGDHGGGPPRRCWSRWRCGPGTDGAASAPGTLRDYLRVWAALACRSGKMALSGAAPLCPPVGRTRNATTARSTPVAGAEHHCHLLRCRPARCSADWRPLCSSSSRHSPGHVDSGGV